MPSSPLDNLDNVHIDQIIAELEQFVALKIKAEAANIGQFEPFYYPEASALDSSENAPKKIYLYNYLDGSGLPAFVYRKKDDPSGRLYVKEPNNTFYASLDPSPVALSYCLNFLSGINGLNAIKRDKPQNSKEKVKSTLERISKMHEAISKGYSLDKAMTAASRDTLERCFGLLNTASKAVQAPQAPDEKPERSERPDYINRIIAAMESYIDEKAKVAPQGVKPDFAKKITLFFHHGLGATEAYTIAGDTDPGCLYFKHDGYDAKSKPLSEEEKRFYAAKDRSPATLARIDIFLRAIDKLKEPNLSPGVVTAILKIVVSSNDRANSECGSRDPQTQGLIDCCLNLNKQRGSSSLDAPKNAPEQKVAALVPATASSRWSRFFQTEYVYYYNKHYAQYYRYYYKSNKLCFEISNDKKQWAPVQSMSSSHHQILVTHKHNGKGVLEPAPCCLIFEQTQATLERLVLTKDPVWGHFMRRDRLSNGNWEWLSSLKPEDSEREIAEQLLSDAGVGLSLY